MSTHHGGGLMTHMFKLMTHMFKLMIHMVKLMTHMVKLSKLSTCMLRRMVELCHLLHPTHLSCPLNAPAMLGLGQGMDGLGFMLGLGQALPPPPSSPCPLPL